MTYVVMVLILSVYATVLVEVDKMWKLVEVDKIVSEVYDYLKCFFLVI